MNDHVTSYEMSQKLRKRGLPQDTVFFWGWNHDGENHWKVVSRATAMKLPEASRVAAYMVSELGNLLPDHFNISYKRVSRDGPTRCAIDCYDSKAGVGTWKLYPKRTNEADARAHMVDYLLSFGFLTLKTS